MRRARITFGYDGTRFHGSQSQLRVRTVQDELQRAVDTVAPGSGQCVLAGRTDRGVHAVGQVASVDVAWRRAPEDLRAALDAVTPDDIYVRDVTWAAPGFHARYDARWREYRYRLAFGSPRPALESPFVWWRRAPLDDDAAAAAARAFIGEHALGAFASSGWSLSRSRAELTRTVRHCEWRRTDTWDAHGHHVAAEFVVVANGFLPQMVRNMVSAVIAVGSGEHQPGWIDELLESGQRGDLGEAAPPHGLTLWQVEYDTQSNVSADGRSLGECEEA